MAQKDGVRERGGRWFNMEVKGFRGGGKSVWKETGRDGRCEYCGKKRLG